MNQQQLDRYKRHTMLPSIGIEGQERILNSKVLIIGVGGLGSPVALYLAAAGVGTIGLIDNDNVDLSNLQRQVIHTTNDIGVAKVESAKNKILALNPDINVITYKEYFDEQNALRIMRDYDIMIDATDNSDSKFFINDVCVKHNKALVHGAINQFAGNVMTIIPGTANYRTLFPEQPQNPTPSSSYGVLGVIAGTIGMIQATEALKYITGVGTLLTNKILVFDSLTMSFEIINI